MIVLVLSEFGDHTPSNPCLGSRPVHDDEDPDQADGATQEVEHIRDLLGNQPAPGDRENDKDPAVGCVDAPEMGWMTTIAVAPFQDPTVLRSSQ